VAPRSSRAPPGAGAGADGVAADEPVPTVDDLVASTVVGSVPDWSLTGPPRALSVAGAAFFIAFWITQMFRMVYAATVDTLFVCMFRDDDFLAGKYSSGAGSSSSAPAPRS